MNELHLAPWRMKAVVPINDDLRRLLGLPTLPKRVEVGVEDRFVAGWNAAVRYMREHPDPVNPEDVLPGIERVIFNEPATIVYWDDGSKTVVKCQHGDTFSAETGLATAMLKRYMGNDNTFNRVINEWLKRTGQYKPSVVPTDQESPETAE